LIPRWEEEGNLYKTQTRRRQGSQHKSKPKDNKEDATNHSQTTERMKLKEEDGWIDPQKKHFLTPT
jgi:hypothetical protein